MFGSALPSSFSKDLSVLLPPSLFSAIIIFIMCSYYESNNTLKFYFKIKIFKFKNNTCKTTLFYLVLKFFFEWQAAIIKTYANTLLLINFCLRWIPALKTNKTHLVFRLVVYQAVLNTFGDVFKIRVFVARTFVRRLLFSAR